jgi:hypothetical protein
VLKSWSWYHTPIRVLPYRGFISHSIVRKYTQ